MDIELIRKTLINDAPRLLGQHILLVIIAILISCAIAIPLGILFTRGKETHFSRAVLKLFGIFQSIPSFAFIAIAMPLLGIGFKPAIIALVVQSILPIIRGTISGIIELDKNIIEAAKGMGMDKKKILAEVELPLALPSIINGVKTSTVYTVSAATLAGFIGAGGLGILISRGLSAFCNEYILVGAVLGAVLAILLDYILGKLERRLSI
ncbi:MAG: ABC transporter permease [Andreesenia angusta]|nr:ABC transporter permease [Andreesenia angusta]